VRSQPSVRFTVLTSSGMGTYRSRAKAMAAALWVAHESGQPVSVMNRNTGQSWEVSDGLVSGSS
jgi:hypothetical protein